MNCPSCSAETPDAVEECPSCGVIFAKWKAKAEKQAAEAPPPAAVPAPAARGRGYGLAALVAVALAAGGAFTLYQKSVTPPPVDDGKPIYDPTPYRGQIYALEKTLYTPGAPSKTDADALKNLGLQLAGQVEADHAANPYVQKAVDDLVLFAGQVSDDASHAKIPAGARKGWIAAWEALRAKRFARARWFHPAQAAAQQ